MAGSLNQATLIGYAGKDPEIRNLQNGSRVASLSIVTSESWTDKQTGEKREKTEWHRIVIWNDKLIEIVEKYVRKGSRLYVEGTIQTRKWTDQSGQERYSTEIVLQGFNGRILLLSKIEDQPSQQQVSTQQYSERTYSQPQEKQSNYQLVDDEVPF